jgi:hypothetical protein
MGTRGDWETEVGMRVVLTKKMVVGHVMRYPGEVVEVPDAAEVDAEVEAKAEVEAEVEAEVKAPRGRKRL